MTVTTANAEQISGFQASDVQSLIERIDWDKVDGLVPVIVQDNISTQTLPSSPFTSLLFPSTPPLLSTVHIPLFLSPLPRSSLQISVIISRRNLDDRIVSTHYGQTPAGS